MTLTFKNPYLDREQSNRKSIQGREGELAIIKGDFYPGDALRDSDS
jgi:hypothetical protein